MRCFLALIILVLVIMRSAKGQDGETYEYRYTIGKNRTVPLLLLPREPHVQRGTVDVDPLPDGQEYTGSTTLAFNASVEVLLTLTNLTAWRRTLCNQTDVPRRVLQRINTEKKFVWKNNTDETWTEVKSYSCRHLYVNRTNFSNSFKVSPLILNQTVKFNARSVEIQLKDVPSNEWCAVHIQFMASLLPANYCQNEGEFYCNESLQCVNDSARCDEKVDCDLREDEFNCPKNVTAEAILVQPFVYGLSGFIAAIVAAVAFVAICYYLKQRRDRQRRCFRTTILQDKESHVYDYPTFSEEMYPLSTRDSSASSKNIGINLDPTSRTHTVTYDTSGIYSRVITVSQAY